MVLLSLLLLPKHALRACPLGSLIGEGIRTEYDLSKTISHVYATIFLWFKLSRCCGESVLVGRASICPSFLSVRVVGMGSAAGCLPPGH